MRKCLSPFFIGRDEPGLDRGTGPFDIKLPLTLVGIEPGSKNAINSINCAIRDFIAETVVLGEKPMVLSGDCLSAIGCLAGLQKCDIYPYFIWFDAHGDFHTPETTISGHLGGMPLAMITGRGDQSLLSAVDLKPLPDRKVYFVGGRDLEVGEKEALEESKINKCERITEILSELPKESYFWVHFDMDYIIPIDAPAMRYPAEGGVSAQIIKSDLNTLASCINILGLSVSAWAPHLDVNAQTAIVCWDVISTLVI
jgi:arginase